MPLDLNNLLLEYMTNGVCHHDKTGLAVFIKANILRTQISSAVDAHLFSKVTYISIPHSFKSKASRI